jgi:hypothetical protein
MLPDDARQGVDQLLGRAGVERAPSDRGDFVRGSELGEEFGVFSAESIDLVNEVWRAIQDVLEEPARALGVLDMGTEHPVEWRSH